MAVSGMGNVPEIKTGSVTLNTLPRMKAKVSSTVIDIEILDISSDEGRSCKLGKP